MERENKSGFEELVVWQEARKFRQTIRLLVQSFPGDERYRLVDQLIRASRSISANIAEGYGRYHFQENIQFCRQARGSLTECLDHLICACDEGYITADQLQEQRANYHQVIKLLNGYISYLKERKKTT
ncbi:four helix bundle protein [Spirosoma aerophilum]